MSSQMLSDAITVAIVNAITLSQRAFTNSPIFVLSEVNMTRGKTANES
jgi:hypothetical protein